MKQFASWHKGIRFVIFYSMPRKVEINGKRYKQRFIMFAEAWDFCIETIDKMEKK